MTTAALELLRQKVGALKVPSIGLSCQQTARAGSCLEWTVDVWKRRSVPSDNYLLTSKSHLLFFRLLWEVAAYSQKASVSCSPSAMVTSKFMIRHYKTWFIFLFFSLFILTDDLLASESHGWSEGRGKGDKASLGSSPSQAGSLPLIIAGYHLILTSSL